MAHRYIKKFRVLTNKGRIVAHCDTIETAEYHAHHGRGRYIVFWFEGGYKFRSQF